MNLQSRPLPGAAPLAAEHQHDAPTSPAVAGVSLAQFFPRLTRYRTALIVALALFFVWEIITRSFTAYLADENPELAVALRYNQPTALIKLADRALNAKQKAQKQKSEVDCLSNRTDNLHDLIVKAVLRQD